MSRRLICELAAAIALVASAQPSAQVVLGAGQALPDPHAASVMARPAHLEETRALILRFEAEEDRLGADSPDLLPAIHELADWYERSGQPEAARRLSRRAVGLIETSYGVDDARLAADLKRIAVTWSVQGKYQAEGREALERVVHLYEGAAEPDPMAQADALVTLGDWHMLAGDPDAAIAAYADAWAVLAGEDSGAARLADDRLGRPMRVQPELVVAQPGPASAAQAGQYTALAFTVTPAGSARDISVTGSTAPPDVARDLRRAVAQSVYRPGFQNGRPVAMQMRLVVPFREGDAAALPSS